MMDGSLPVSARGRALFLDVDGTLLEIAESPDAVRVPERLKDLLAKLVAREGGAVALVSGRQLRQLDELFAPLKFAAAGLHGLERRDARGRYFGASDPSLATLPAFARARVAMTGFAWHHPELVFEDKGLTLALHFRRAPALESEVAAFVGTLLADLGPSFQLQAGKCVLEIRPATGSKRTAIEAFMKEAPFAGRRPLFVGDDVTDEDGFAAVNALGGDSIRVGPFAGTRARWQLPDVAGVLDWLAAAVEES
jgi:trehalose 6-phosphate phosphatase